VSDTDDVVDDLKAPPRMSDVPPAENYAAPSTRAEREFGVLYQGEFETPSDGTAIAVRRHAAALSAAGIPVLLRSFSNVVVNEFGVAEPVHLAGLDPDVEREIGHLRRTDVSALRPVIKHAVIRSAEHCRQLLIPRGFLFNSPEEQLRMRDVVYDNTIVFSVWERDRIEEGVARQLARIKQCWVPSAHNARLLIAAGVPESRVHVVPHPYVNNDLIHRCLERRASSFEGWRRFYSIGRWEPRKGFDALIEAFLGAFKPGDKASLVIKYSGSGQWGDYPTPEEILERVLLTAGATENGWTAESLERHVACVGGRLRRSMIAKLHHDNNIYVSASRGEAFALPLFDAKLAGNRCVYVPYGGPADLVEATDLAVPFTMAPVDPSYGWERDAQWAVCTTENLAQALRRVEPPDEFRRPAAYEERFSMQAVGQQMRQLVESAVGPGIY